ncbi:MAG: nucleotidyltransferase family protein [Hespellia sp.]|nr:nucleotidyltransferase family protein [Hespellia sp.]
MKKTDIILLAAGDSRRYGEDNKLLAVVDGKAMFTYAVDMAVKVRQRQRDQVGTIVVVSKYREIKDYVTAQKKEFLLYQQNDHSERGISESIHIGVAATDQGHDAVFCVCDQPRMKVETVCRLIQEFAGSGKKAGVVTDEEGNQGNPCIFASSMRQELLTITGDTGGKKLIHKLPPNACLYVKAEKTELEDIDVQKK